jgi:NADH:ubiquinone oxidoreductase subunit C
MNLASLISIVLVTKCIKNISYIEYITSTQILFYFKNLNIFNKCILIFKNFQFLTGCHFIDLFASDMLNLYFSKRYELNYIIRTYVLNVLIFVRFSINEFEFIDSLSNIFLGSNYLEREIYDLFGLWFINTNDLRRILTDYGFKGYPLRKDFPISGYFELIYSNIYKTIIYNPIKLSQTYRGFAKLNPWKI